MIFVQVISFHKCAKIKFECKECDYETTQRGHFVKHHEYVHRLSLLISVKIKFECKECDYDTTQRGHFVKHHEYVHRLSLLIIIL